MDSIGVNGEAVNDPDAGVNGVWVSSVESGSPADTASIESGDIITRLEGLDLALSFAQQLGDDVAADPASAADTYDAYVSVSETAFRTSSEFDFTLDELDLSDQCAYEGRSP